MSSSAVSRSSLLMPAQALSLLGLARPSSSSSSSILPTLPRSVRWLLVLIALLNYRALPGVWHLRVFWSIISIRLRGLLKWSSHPKRRQFVKELSPIGENPFDICVTYKTTVGLTDTDYNGHLSNSSYAKNLDYARMRAAVFCFPSVLEAKGWLGLGSSHFYFIKEIPLLAEYEIRINIGGWDNKWLHLVVQFVTYPNGRKDVKEVRQQARSSGGSTPNGTEPNVPPIEEQPLAYTPPTRYYVSPATAEAYNESLTPAREEEEEEGEDVRTTAASAGADDTFTPSGSTPSSSSLSSSEARSRSVSDSSFTTQSSYTSEEDEGGFIMDEEEEEGEGTGSSGSSTAASSPPCSSPHKMPMNLPVSHSLSSLTSQAFPRSPSALPPDNEKLRTSSFSTPISPSSTNETQPAHVSPSVLSAMPTLPEGAVLHCIHVSSYCFKHGRITIPPRVALVASGFGDPQRKRWERVQDIRDTRKYPIDAVYLSSSSPSNYPSSSSPSTTGEMGQEQSSWTGLRAILRGGWRQYEHEGLWDLPEYEDQRLAALEAFGNLRAQMAVLRSTTSNASATTAHYQLSANSQNLK